MLNQPTIRLFVISDVESNGDKVISYLRTWINVREWLMFISQIINIQRINSKAISDVG
jgi:hypothetical protein